MTEHEIRQSEFNDYYFVVVDDFYVKMLHLKDLRI